ncbi:MAG: hypothetical protein IT353_24545 [Gemmatimonadaceae bacterium]|nr:hypothetical protein [Gemmatimonadaceae bacterium]
MTWTSQLLHVWRRDVLQLRWYLLAYAVCVIALVARFFALVSLGGTGGWLGPLLVIVAMFITALAMQSDAAASDHAAWRALPLDGSAVASAKLCLLLSLVAIGLIGQHIALLVFDIPLAEHVRLGVRASVAMLTWLMFSALVAAYTRNIRWYLTLTLALPILAVLLSWFALASLAGAFEDAIDTEALAEFGQRSFGALRAAVAIAAVGVLLLAYTRRVRRWVGASIASLVLCAGFVLQVASSVSSNSVPAQQSATKQTVRGETRWRIDVGSVDTAVVAWRSMRSDAAPADRVVLENGMLVLRFSDSSIVRVWLNKGEYSEVGRTPGANGSYAFSSAMRNVVFVEPRQIASTGIAWPDAKDSVEHRVTVPLVLSAPRRAEITAGRVQAWLEGEAKLLTSVIAIEARASAGTSSTSDGLRLQVHGLRNDDLMPTLSVLDGRRGFGEADPPSQVAAFLLDSNNAVTLPMFEAWGGESPVIVLPGVSRHTYSTMPIGSKNNRKASGNRPGSATLDSPGRVVVVKWGNPRWVRFVTAPSVVESVSLQDRGGWREGTSAKEAIEVRRD